MMYWKGKILYITKPFLLRLCGWGVYYQRKRESLTKNVGAHWRLWLRWFLQAWNPWYNLKQCRGIIESQDNVITSLKYEIKVLREKLRSEV